MEDSSLSTPTQPIAPAAPAPSPQKPLPRFTSVSPREWFAVPSLKRSRGVNRGEHAEVRARSYSHPPAGLLDAAVFVSCYQCGEMVFFRHASLELAASSLRGSGWTVSYPRSASSEAKKNGEGLWLCSGCLKVLYAAENELKSLAPSESTE